MKNFNIYETDAIILRFVIHHYGGTNKNERGFSSGTYGLRLLSHYFSSI